MPEVGLDDSQIDSRFEQMCGPGMTQRMDGGSFLYPTFEQRGVECLAQGIFGHGLIGQVRAVFNVPVRGKDPDRVAVGQPELAQHLEDAFGQGEIPIFSPFPVADVDHFPFGIDILDLEADAFVDAQPTPIDRVQAHPAAECVNDLRQLILEFTVEVSCVGEIISLLSFRKVVEKWTGKRCPLFNNHYYDDGDWVSSCLSAGLGGLIQTASGNSGGLGSPLTNRSGFF